MNRYGILMVLLLSISFLAFGCGKSQVPYPSTQEYIPGQGNIKGDLDVDDFKNIDASFEIGANKNGYAVFKDPDKAFSVFKKKYSKGLELIRKEFKLDPISNKNYDVYMANGWQVKTGTEEEKSQADFVSRFLDIYENSFQSDK